MKANRKSQDQGSEVSEGAAGKSSRQNSIAGGIMATVEWLIIAFTFTLIFIVFEMQAYTIPTGSMADTLHGAHFRLRCSQCGYRYDYNFSPDYYRMPENSVPGFDVPIRPGQPRCPSCGYYLQSGKDIAVIKGDRIFVAKCLYQFSDPKRWDVVVFKNPADPSLSYIKRMIALPGETIEIIDGDIYINGRIARKPARVQEEMWMPVYDNDYRPVNPNAGVFNGHLWRQPFENVSGSRWDLSAEGPSVFGLDSDGGQQHTILYNTSVGNNFQATYAYDPAVQYPYMPICSDLMVQFYVKAAGAEGSIGAGLSKYGVGYRGLVDLSGQMIIEKLDANGRAEELARRQFPSEAAGRCVRFRFANVDHQLVLEFGRTKLKYDAGMSADDMGQRLTVMMPAAAIIGSGSLRLSHIGVFRDMHYLGRNINGVISVVQGAEGAPFALGEDEFFVLGDNTPASADSRAWSRAGVGNNGRQYRQGTVPRDYLTGKAFFVYWPGPLKPFERFKVIPYAGGMKIIAGGSERGQN